MLSSAIFAVNPFLFLFSVDIEKPAILEEIKKNALASCSHEGVLVGADNQIRTGDLILTKREIQ